MENQHRQIKGYRELNQAEIDLMNEVKGIGEQLSQIIDKCRDVDAKEAATGVRETDGVLAEAARWRAIAKTHLQQGLMALTRAVAKPGFF